MTLQQILEAARALSEAERRRLREELEQDAARQQRPASGAALLGLWESDDAVAGRMVEELMHERETRRLRA